MKKKQIIVLVGMSGSGKTTVGDFLKRRGIPELISHTTRPKRAGEAAGYYYVQKDFFTQIEKVEVTEYAGNFYGLSIEEVEKKLAENDMVFAITDYHGYKEIQHFCAEKHPEFQTVMVFVNISLYNAQERMRVRGDTEENIQKRIMNSIVNKETENSAFTPFVLDNNGTFTDTAEQMNKYLVSDFWVPAKTSSMSIPIHLAKEYGTHNLLAAYALRTFGNLDNIISILEDKLYQIDVMCEETIKDVIDTEQEYDSDDTYYNEDEEDYDDEEDEDDDNDYDDDDYYIDENDKNKL